MNIATIEKLAYLLKQAREKGLPQPIVFLGAGASKTGGVPLAGEIVNDILEKYKENPDIKFLNDDEKTYPKLMECLTPFERNKLLKEYVERAKINVTHIYLAQLLIEGYVDYVLTVNFDNLMLRALALFNSFPATYDMAILKDLTTTSFKEKSVVFLHGQHHGLWLLNTVEEMTKVKEIIPPILNSIKNQRPWIFIGYSGEDPIFEHIIKLGRFDNGLYWVSYYDSNPRELVCSDLLEKANTNSFLIKGYDADSFMLKLSTELSLPQPLIIDKPFTSLKNTLENIVDIDDKEHFKDVKVRLDIVTKDVMVAIQRFEEGSINYSLNSEGEININLLKKEVIDVIIRGDFNQEKILEFEKTANSLKNEEINILMARLINNWAIEIKANAKSKNDEDLYKLSFDKYQKAIELNPKLDSAFNNWGNALYDLAKLKDDEDLYKLSFEKYQKAVELNPKLDSAFNNWAIAIKALAKLKNDEELYKLSFDKYQKAIELNPNDDSAYFNWGTAIYELAKLKMDVSLYELSFIKYQKATELNPKDDSSFNNWGTAIYDLAKLKNDVSLYELCFKKYQKATELNPKLDSAFYNWGTAISDLADLIDDEKLYLQSIEKLNKSIELGGRTYNLACIYAYRKDKVKALEILEESFKKNEVNAIYVCSDKDWNAFYDDVDFKELIDKYK